MTSLTKENIDHLFDFVKSKYVRYYDVQLELVDHLASAIEEEMNADSNLSFKAGLNKVYSRFPVTGFNNFIQEKTKGLQIFWAKKFFAFALDYFRFPKIILTIGITLILFLLSQQVLQFGSLQMNGLSLALIVLIIVQWVTFLMLPKAFTRADNNNLLSVSAFKGLIFTALYMPYQIILQLFLFPENVNWAASTGGQIIAIFLSIFGVAIIIITDGVRTKGMDWINDEIYNKYPEYFEKETSMKPTL